jgi:hypothetical protein
VGAFAVLACAHASGPQTTFLKTPSDPYLPNYAKRLLSPFRNSEVAPELLHVFTHFPVRVTVLDDTPLYSDKAFKMVERAGERWALATHSGPSGGVSFAYSHGPSPDNADIVVALVTPNELGINAGLTTNEGAYQMMRIRVVSTTGGWLPTWLVERVATHEIGHALGISGHSPNRQDVMSENDAASEVTRADANTLRIAYGGTFR